MFDIHPLIAVDAIFYSQLVTVTFKMKLLKLILVLALSAVIPLFLITMRNIYKIGNNKSIFDVISNSSL